MPPKTRAAKRLAIASGLNIQLQSLLPTRRPRQNIQPPAVVIPPIPNMLPDLPLNSILDMGPMPPPGHIPDNEWQFDNHRSTNYMLDLVETYIEDRVAINAPGPTASEAFLRLPRYEDYDAEMTRRGAVRPPSQPDPANIVSFNYLGELN